MTNCNRRDFLHHFGLTGLLAAACPAALAGAQTPAPGRRRPNIVLILADDLGYGDLGCYGQKVIKTPNLDRMAAEGMRFTRHYAGTTVCAPSRCALLTGLHTGHCYIRGNAPVALRDDPEDVSIARRLKDAGYHTALIGKSGLSGNIDDGAHPNRKGFDHFFGFVSHSAAHRHYPRALYRNGEKVSYPQNEGKEGKAYDLDLFSAEVSRYLGEHRAGPFFLHYAITQPHADMAVPDESRKAYEGKVGQEEAFAGNGYRAEPEVKATYAGMVSRLDAEVGRVLARLRELGIERDTLVLFASDNGAMSEGGYRREYFQSSGPLRGGKRDLYEGGLRVPFLARWPGMVPAGRISDHVAAFWDFPATALELAGAAPIPGTDGLSYLPTLLGKPGQKAHEYLYWEFHEQGGKRAVRMGDWKAVQLQVDRAPDGAVEVYDLKADPAEAKDVAATRPEVVEKARALFASARTSSSLPRFNFGQAAAATGEG